MSYKSITFSSFLGDLEATHHTITATDGKCFSAIAEIACEHCSTEIVDPIAWLKERITVEYFNLVGTTAASYDQVKGVLLELGSIQGDWFI